MNVKHKLALKFHSKYMDCLSNMYTTNIEDNFTYHKRVFFLQNILHECAPVKSYRQDNNFTDWRTLLEKTRQIKMAQYLQEFSK